MRVIDDMGDGPTLALEFDVLGVPAPQGSKSAWIGWHPPFGTPFTEPVFKAMQASVRMRESASTTLKAWRKAVKVAAAAAMAGNEPYDEPVVVALDFWMPRPSNTRAAALWHIKYPDVDKLIRSTYDGLKAGGVVADDARIVSGPPTKRYVPHERGRRATTPTGCRIAVYLLPEGADLQWRPVMVPYETAPTWVPTEGTAA